MKKTEVFQKVFLYLSIPQAIETLRVIFMIMIWGIILLWNNPFWGWILFVILLMLSVFAIIAIPVNRKEVKRVEEEKKRVEEEKKRMLGDLEKGLNIKEAGMDFLIKDKLPVVVFTIAIEKRIKEKLQPQKMLLDLTCDSIPLKTYLWDRDYNIECVKESHFDIYASDIEEIGDGEIIIKYPCVHVSYHYIHEWKLIGKVTYHSKIGDITRGIKLSFQLKDKKEEEKLKSYLKYFQKSYVEERGTRAC